MAIRWRTAVHRPDRQIPPVEMPAPDVPDRPRWRRILLRICLSGILLISITLALDVIGAVRLNRAMSAARAGGEPLTYQELFAPAASSENPNAASVFLDLRPRLAELAYDTALRGFWSRRSGWRQALLGYRWSDEDRQTVGEVLARHKAELEQLSRLRTLPHGNLPLAITEDDLGNPRRPLWEVRLATRLCSLQALYGVEEGQFDHLLESTGVILRLAHLIGTHPSPSGTLVGCSCDEQAVSTIERACGLAVLPDEVLAALERDLAEAERQNPLYWGLLGERASFFDDGQAMLETGRSRIPGIPPTGRVPGMRGLLMMDMAAGVSLHNQLVAEADDPAACLKLISELEGKSSTLPRVYWLTQALFPRPTRLCHFALRRLVRLRAARTGLVVERFRLARGRFPERLTELTPEYLRDLPVDPSDGGTLCYRVDAEGAVIYSDAEELGEEGWGGRGWVSRPAEPGFVLLPPDQRGRAATQPAMPPASAPGGE